MENKKHKRKLFIFESLNQKPLPTNLFIGRLARYILAATLLVICALGIGILGYHLFENFSLIDSFLNASMILGGMRPVNEIHTEVGKLFAGMYALFSGLVFLVAVGLIIAPIFHRILHKFHFEDV